MRVGCIMDVSWDNNECAMGASCVHNGMYNGFVLAGCILGVSWEYSGRSLGVF